MLLLYIRYSASSYLNPHKVFLYLHTWVSFWYKILSQVALFGKNNLLYVKSNPWILHEVYLIHWNKLSS
jgi:hypothetical protein